MLGSVRCFSKKIVVYLKSGSPTRVQEALGYNNRGYDNNMGSSWEETPAPAFHPHTNARRWVHQKYPPAVAAERAVIGALAVEEAYGG